MIDHDAAVELWDRYKRGERNVFTRRLYTMQGQKTFEEIRKRYRADREFKQTVDRYVGEFERLLDEVSRDDRGQVVARTYLTSETGKVYLMLAHAAGRFWRIGVKQEDDHETGARAPVSFSRLSQGPRACPGKPAHLMRGGYRFSEKDMRQRKN